MIENTTSMAKRNAGCKNAGCGKEVLMRQQLWSNYEELREMLCGVLGGLSPLEREVLKMRFGLDDGRCRDYLHGYDAFFRS